MSAYLTHLQCEQVDGDHWKLLSPLIYVRDNGEQVRALDGFVTDFASTPRPVWWLMPPSDEYTPAAVTHDWLYRMHTLEKKFDVWPPAVRCCTRKEADNIFLEAMAVLGVARWKRVAMWAAVRAFGWAAWK